MQAHGTPSGALDNLVAAVTAAASSDFPNPQAGNTSANLDAIFGTNSFSSAYSNATVQKPEEAISPLWARMLLNHFVQSLSTTLVGASPNPDTMAANLDSAHEMIQTTRSGRVSRPPVVNTRLLEDLQNGGMASVLDALRTTNVPVPPTPPIERRADTWSTRPEVAGKAAKLASAVPKHLTGWAWDSRHEPSVGQNPAVFSTRDSNGHTALDYSHPSPRSSSSRARVISGRYFQSVQEKDAANAEVEAGQKRAGSFDSEEEEEPLRKLARDDEEGERKMRAGRPVMSKAEALEKRRERNKKSAMLSRQKKKMKMGDLEERLGQSEACIRELEEHCEVMEDEVERLQNILQSHGINPTTGTSTTSASLPISPALPSPAHFNAPSPHLALDPMINSAPSASIPGLNNLSVPTVDSSAFDSSPFDPNAFDFNAPFDFNTFFSFNDDEDDGEFIPRSSPKRDTDTEAESDHDNTPKKKRKSKRKGKQHQPDEEQEEEDEEFVDEEEEDEDLFMPIEDVPYPPEAIAENVHDLTGDMMKALKVDTRQQLAAVMQKLVDSAGEGGVTDDIVERLKSVIDLAAQQ